MPGAQHLGCTSAVLGSTIKGIGGVLGSYKRRMLMSQPTTKSLIATILVMVLLCMTSLAGTNTPYITDDRAEDVPAEAIILDTFLLRPLGFAATVVGTAVFVVSLPFSIPTKQVDKAAQKLVVAPAKYTFTRPLGQESN
jgi:hypothetical protein